jgi:hypothetical protein
MHQFIASNGKIYTYITKQKQDVYLQGNAIQRNQTIPRKSSFSHLILTMFYNRRHGMMITCFEGIWCYM